MSEYPLSAKSSKKFSRLRSPLSSLGSSVQTQQMQGLRAEEYAQILAGERIFIELYCQGKVVATDYNQWVRFMGGTLHKRLNDRVTIFLTNSHAHELTAVLERVRRSCSNCRVVSILWFEQCFLEKTKVPFDSFALDGEKEELETEDGAHKCEEQLAKFMADAAEDVELEMRDFFKKQEKQHHPFQYLTRGQTSPMGNWFGCKEIDLGPNPNRKVKGRGDKNRKRRKSSFHTSQTHPVAASPRESKSLNGEETSNEKKQESPKPPEQKPSRRRDTLENLMSKYLKEEVEVEVEVEKTVSIEAKSMAEITNIFGKEESKKASSERPLSIKDQFLSSSKSAGAAKRFNIGFRYKDANKEELFGIQPLPSSELEDLKALLLAAEPNTLLVVSPFGKGLQSKISKINQLGSTNCVRIQAIDYELYLKYLGTQPPYSAVYFLVDPMRLVDRPYFYALRCLNASQPIPVSLKLLDEVRAYNDHVQNMRLPPAFRFDPAQLKYTRPLRVSVRDREIRGKRVAILSSELPVELQKRVVVGLGGVFVSKEQYLLDEEIEIIVGNRWGIQDSGKQCYCECDLWKILFRIEELDAA